ncbi:hypothetical protein [Mycobacterium phage Fezzik]|nr:hypothetical protein [Mycobacterium phage Fezzik]
MCWLWCGPCPGPLVDCGPTAFSDAARALTR